MKRKVLFLVLVCGLLSSCSFNAPAEITSAYQDIPETIDFNFHVKPILSDRCYTCHGPDLL